MKSPFALFPLMSCFWDALFTRLPSKYKQTPHNIRNIQNLYHYMKTNNKKIRSIKINNKPLTPKFKHECFLAVQNHRDPLNDGYWCSTADPFLLLYSYLFNISIKHRYINNEIHYQNTKKNCNTTLLFHSNHNHFSIL